MTAPESPSPYQLRRFVPSYESLGILIDFLTHRGPFAAYRSGTLVAALRYQIAQGCHVAAFRADRLVGYGGWLRIMAATGEAWVGSAGELEPVPEENADAVALTIVRVEEPGAVLPVIRACRKLEPGKRVFFRRDYSDGERMARRNSVLNTTGTGEVKAASP